MSTRTKTSHRKRRTCGWSPGGRSFARVDATGEAALSAGTYFTRLEFVPIDGDPDASPETATLDS